jgi:hypothetical protein
MQKELVINLHIHTTYSDGSENHQSIAQAALHAGLDAIIFTDHNVLVHGIEGYQTKENHRLMVLVGEEIHDRMAQPQRNHMLVLGAGRELAALANNRQQLIDQALQSDGAVFLAHPHDLPMEIVNEEGIAWEDWSVRNYTGIELWNGLSELKEYSQGWLKTAFYAFLPHLIASGPYHKTLKLWNELLAQGQHVVAVGGSDSHALIFKLGPVKKTIFPYKFHFHAINTHLLTPRPLSGDLASDKKMIFTALRQGHAFIGYDLPASTRGFRFTAKGKDRLVEMGDEIPLGNGLTMQIKMPSHAECRLLKDGQIIQIWKDRDVCTFIANQPGVYRVECYIDYFGKKRGWIFSNPIYVRSQK